MAPAKKSGDETASTAVATREQPQSELAIPPRVLNIAKLGQVERVEQSVVIPPIFQYSISRYGQQPKVMLTSDAYDYLNRTMGVQMWQPMYVHDERGQKVLNPIHRSDYIYIRMVGLYYNDIGQLLTYQEDIEVDFKLVYMDARINSKSAKVEIDDEGQPRFSASGMPVIKLDQDDEKRALRTLSQLRTYGIRYAQTVAKTRILKVISGIKTLPISQPAPFAVRVVGFRDQLTPDQRIKQAEEDLSQMFGPGKTVDSRADLTPEELQQVRDLEGADDTEELERDLVNAAIQNQDDSRPLGVEDFEPADQPGFDLDGSPER